MIYGMCTRAMFCAWERLLFEHIITIAITFTITVTVTLANRGRPIFSLDSV